MSRPTPKQLTHRLTFAALMLQTMTQGLRENFAEFPDSPTRRHITDSCKRLREISCTYKLLAQGIERNSPKAGSDA